MLLYCIKCERMVKAEKPTVCPMGHVTFEATEILENLKIIEIDYCCFEDGFAFCPPPDDDPYLLVNIEWTQWIDQARPGDDEILISDLNALSLRSELENDYGTDT